MQAAWSLSPYLLCPLPQQEAHGAGQGRLERGWMVTAYQIQAWVSGKHNFEKQRMVKSRLTGGEVGQDIKLGFSKKSSGCWKRSEGERRDVPRKAFLEPRLKKIRVSIFNSTRGEKQKRNKRQETDSGQFVYKHSNFTPPLCSPWVISRDLCLYWLPAVPFVGVNSSSTLYWLPFFLLGSFHHPRVCSGGYFPRAVSF